MMSDESSNRFQDADFIVTSDGTPAGPMEGVLTLPQKTMEGVLISLRGVCQRAAHGERLVSWASEVDDDLHVVLSPGHGRTLARFHRKDGDHLHDKAADLIHAVHFSPDLCELLLDVASEAECVDNHGGESYRGLCRALNALREYFKERGLK